MSNFEHRLGNGLSIVPRHITMLPGDVQDFTMRGAKIPALYDDANGEYQEGGVVLLTPGEDGNGDGVYWLETGTGQIHIVPDSRMLGSGGFMLRVITGGLDDTVAITADLTQVVFSANGSDINTVPHSVVAGDRIGLELTGSVVYGLVNGVRVGSFILTDDLTRFPFVYDVTLFEPFPPSAPSLLPPILEGDWRIGVPVIWTIEPSAGHLITAGSGATPPITGREAQWIAPNLPTTYTLQAQAGDDEYHAFAVADIFVPTLRILGEREYTVDPQEVLRFYTNYDRAQRADLLTWTAVDGTFSDDVRGQYEAPEAPGGYEVKVTATLEGVTQFDLVTVHVRKVFLPRNICAAKPGEEIDLYTNMEAPEWSTTGGSITGTGQDVVWTGPDTINQVSQICVTDGVDTLCQDVVTLEVMPVDFNLPYGEDIGAEMLVEIADDRRTVWARELSEYGFNPESFELGILGATLEELQDFKAFHATYYPTQRAFFIEDQAQDRRVVVRADSKLKVTAAAGTSCGFDITFRVVKTGCPFI